MCAVNAVPSVLRGFKKNQNDYSGVAEVATAVWPDYPTTLRELRHDDAQRNPDLIFKRIVAELDGRIVAYGAYGQAEGALRPGTFIFNASVHPDHRRRGLGAAIYDHVIDALSPHRPRALIAFTHDTQADALGFLERRGFEVVLRRPVLRLDVRSFDERRFRPGKADDTRQAFAISALSDLMPIVPDWKRRCWELDWEILQDIPLAEPPTRLTLERFSRELEDPTFAPESWFIAHHDDEWLGMSIISTDPSTPGTFYTDVTGVRRSYRRQGIATALKLRGIEYVRAQGGQVIETDNEENNPMLDLNLALGFKSGPAFLEFRKAFRLL